MTITLSQIAIYEVFPPCSRIGKQQAIFDLKECLTDFLLRDIVVNVLVEGIADLVIVIGNDAE